MMARTGATEPFRRLRVMGDATITAAREVFEDSVSGLHAVISSLSADALNWRPAGGDGRGVGAEEIIPRRLAATRSGAHALRCASRLSGYPTNTPPVNPGYGSTSKYAAGVPPAADSVLPR